MSKTVDERVVSMQFDNKEFEKNVKTSMSTLDKLKQTLNFKGASKGLENVNTAIKKVNVSPLSNGLDSVRVKFSALEVMGVTAIANITNSAVNAGKRIASALTIDPIKTGFKEYETQINAVQTILANTSSKGTTLDQVNNALDELNNYADKTIYNFTEMTRNIGTFTAAGVDLETSVSAIQGIANLAAISGSNSQQASTAMYQLSQALAAGSVKLMDWNSVVNAGMGGEVFQNALKETSRLLGTGAEEAIKAEGSFRESLKAGWLTSEVLTETLKKFTTSGANEYVSEYTGLSKEAVKAALKDAEAKYGEADAIEHASQALAEKSSKNKAEIKSVLEMAKTAEDSATKVKTFTQLIDTLKESIQSGWTQTWELLIGDFEETKSLFTSISDFLSNIINKFSEGRNKLLEGALGNPFSDLAEKISKVTGVTNEMSSALKDCGDIVDKVINGDFGNGEKRFNELTKAGYDWANIQNLVNERLGNTYSYVTNNTEAQNGLNEAQAKTITDLIKLSDAELENMGFTNEEIKSFRELEKQSEKTGIPIEELIKDLDQLNGRALLLDSFKNIGSSLVKIFSAIGKAWREIFPATTSEQLYNIIASFHGLTEQLKVTDETADKIRRTFKGLFAIIDLIRMVIVGSLEFAFKTLKGVMGGLNIDILDTTANVGDAIVAFHDWVKANNKLVECGEKVGAALSFVATQIKNIIETIKQLPAVQKFITNFNDSVQNIKTLFGGFAETIKANYDDFKIIGEYAIKGLENGLVKGIVTIPGILFEIGKKMLLAICTVLGIHSPSKEMHDVGIYATDGLVNGLEEGSGGVFDKIKEIGDKLLEFVGNLRWDKIFAVIVSTALIGIALKLTNVIEALTKPLSGLGDLLSETAKVIGKFGKVLNSLSFNLKMKAIKELTVGLAILIGSFVLLTYMKVENLWQALGVITALSIIMVGLSVALSKLSSATATVEKGKFSLKTVAPKLIALGMALLMMSAVVKIMGGMDENTLKQGIGGITVLLFEIIAVFGMFGILVKGKSAKNIDKVGWMMVKMGAALMTMVTVVKLAGSLDENQMKKGVSFVGVFVIFVALIQTISLIPAKNIEKTGNTILKVTIAILLMLVVVKLAGGLTPDQMLKGCGFVLGFLMFVSALCYLSDKYKKVENVGRTLLAISGSMLILALVCKIIGTMSWGNLAKAGVSIVAFTGIISFLILTIGKIERDAPKIAGTLLAISTAMLMLAGICVILGLMDPFDMIQGVGIIGLLSIMMAMLIGATKNANDCKGNIIAMSVTISVLAASMVILSFIPWQKIIAPTIALCAVMGMLSLMFVKAGKMKPGGMSSIVSMTVTIAVLATAMLLLSKIPFKDLISAAGALGLVIIALTASIGILNEIKMDTKSIVTISVMSAVVSVLAGALYLIAGLNPNATLSSVIALSTLLLVLSGVMIILGNLKPIDWSTVATIGVMSAVVSVLAGALYLIAGLNPEASTGAVIKLGALLLTLSGVMFILSTIKSVDANTIITLGIMTVVISALAMVLYSIASLPIEASKTAVAELVVLMISLSAVMFIMSKISPSGSISMIAASASMVVLAAALRILTPAMQAFEQISWSSLGKCLLTIASAFLILGVAGYALAPVILPILGISAAFVLIGVSAMAVGTGLMYAANAFMTISNINTSGFLANVTAVGTALQIVITSILGIFPLIALKIGEGIIMICQVLITKAQIIVQTIVTIVASLITALTTTIPLIVNGVLQLITSILTAISTYAPLIITLIGNIMVTILTGLSTYAPIVIGLIVDTIIGIINAIAERIPDIIQAGINIMVNLIEGLAKGIEDNYERINNAIHNLCTAILKAVLDFFGIHSPSTVFANIGGNLVKGLIEGVGNFVGNAVNTVKELGAKLVSSISDKTKDFLENGKKLISNLKTGIAKTASNAVTAVKDVISKLASAMKEKISAFKDIGKNIIDGLKGGIKAAYNKALDAVKGVAKGLINAAKKILGIKSPSRVFAEIGKFTDEGLAKGLTAYASKVTKASEKVGEGAINGMTNAVSCIGDIANSDLDVTPTIRPVVDLSNTGNEKISLGANISSFITKPMNSLSSLMYDAQAEITASNKEVISAINSLREDISALLNSEDKEIALYVDSKKLATSIAKPMNRQLNILSKRGAY